MEKRKDRLTALLIDGALNSYAARERVDTARILCELGVPLETAIRLLTRPQERRRLGAAAPVAATC
jgi:hypothetical protein